MRGERSNAGVPEPEQMRLGERVSFGPFVLDLVDRSLRRNGVEVRLPSRSLLLLVALVRSAGRTLAKDRLIEDVWRGAYVSDTSLTEAMSRLRRALGDPARDPLYIRTVHGRGYRFIGPLRSCVSEARRRPRSGSWCMPRSIAAMLALVGVLWIALAYSGEGRSQVPAARAAKPPHPLGSWSEAWPAIGGPARGSERPRYRLVQVAGDGAPVSRYRVPPLPLNDLTVAGAGDRVAFSMTREDESDVWVFDPAFGRLELVTDGGYYSDPVWAPGGRALAMAKRRKDSFDLVLRRAGRGGSEQVLLDAPGDQFPESWSRDGRSLIYSERHPETGYDLWQLRQTGHARWTSTPLVRTPAHEAFGAISPNGRYVAFTSADGEGPEVHVVDLESDRAPLRVSRDGGAYPFWSPDGARLHYVDGDQLRTTTTDAFASGAGAEVRASISVAGLHLAGTADSADRFVVALRE